MAGGHHGFPCFSLPFLLSICVSGLTVVGGPCVAIIYLIFRVSGSVYLRLRGVVLRSKDTYIWNTFWFMFYAKKCLSPSKTILWCALVSLKTDVPFTGSNY